MRNQVQNWKFALGGALFAASGLTLYQLSKKYLRARDKIRALQKEPIYSSNDIDLKKLEGLGKKMVLLKLHCKQSISFKHTSKVGSIQYAYDKFPLEKNMDVMMSALRNNDLKLITWKSREIKQPLFLPRAFKEDVFVIEHKYTPSQRGLFGSIVFAIGTVIAFFGDFVINAITLQPSRAAIGGPEIGTLETTFNLVIDQPLIVQCNLQNGVLIPRVMGLTKKDIISLYRDQDIPYFMLQFAIVALFLIVYRKKFKIFFIDPFKQFMSSIMESIFKPKDVKQRNKLLNTDVDNELLCIICMNRCRNIIFQNCDHFSICNQCIKAFGGEEIDKCPLCRKNTDEKYIYVEEYEQGQK